METNSGNHRPKAKASESKPQGVSPSLRRRAALRTGSEAGLTSQEPRMSRAGSDSPVLHRRSLRRRFLRAQLQVASRLCRGSGACHLANSSDALPTDGARCEVRTVDLQRRRQIHSPVRLHELKPEAATPVRGYGKVADRA